jgi:hypothetical protein
LDAVAAADLKDVVDDGNEVGEALTGTSAGGQDVINTLLGAVNRLLLVPMKPEWGTQRAFNCLPTPEDLSARSMETLLVNQLIDRWPLDKGRVELNQGLRPQESAIQTRGDELFNIGVPHLQEPLYICAVVPDEVFTVLKDVHVMSFADPNIV